MENTYDIETYIDKLEGELVRICRECGFPVTSAPKEEAASQTAPSMLLSSPDIDGHWQKLGGDYIADAMPQIADYPTVAVAWAAYLGMAVACGWDSDWAMCANMPYSVYYGHQGVDDMDDHIISDIKQLVKYIDHIIWYALSHSRTCILCRHRLANKYQTIDSKSAPLV